MAKTVITAQSNFDELVTDLLILAEEFPEAIKEAADGQMMLLANAIKTNWATMIPWGKHGDYVYDSIGYNTEYGKENGDVVGMTGVFLIDSVTAKHGYDVPVRITQGPNKNAQKQRIKAPQLAYWAEFGFSPNHGKAHAGIPFMSNAFYATVEEQDRVFADTLSKAINKRLSK